MIALAIVAGVVLLLIAAVVVISADSASEPPREEEALEELGELLDESASEFDAVNQLASELGSDAQLGLEGLESRCIATDLVEGLGASRSLEITISEVDAGLPQAEAEVFADAYSSCIGLREFFERSAASDPAAADLPDFYFDCLFDELGESTLHAEIVAAITADVAANAEIDGLYSAAADRCFASFTPEQLDELAGT